MFASCAQGTLGAAPVHNPFAAVSSKGETNPFGGDSVGYPKKRETTLKNPFQTQDANLSDGSGKQKGKGGRTDGLARKSHGKTGHGKPRQNDKPNQKNGDVQSCKTDNKGSRAISPSSISSDATNETTAISYKGADLLATKIHQRLKKDGINPPPWPSQPGNPNNKQAMAKFREQYETYRKKVRTSLTKAGLIDDPSKRKALSDAIEFKGICEDMCPEFEKITRITELDVVHAEKDPGTTFTDTNKMVKKLARSAAGQEAPLPMDVRSVPSLRRTLDYLLDDLLRDDGNLPVVHGFLWDRTRAIRRDFSFFSSLTHEETKTQVYVLENIARFHVTSLHLLSQEGKAPEDFVQQQELEQLGKALLSLRDVYDDCGEQGIRCENESEFRAYYLLFHARDPSILETLQRQWKPHHWRDSDDVRTAVSLVEALQSSHDFHGPLKNGPLLAASAAFEAYFRIVQDPKVSYTMACFAECHFPQLRRSILQTIKRALSRPKDPAQDVTATALNGFLHFDTVQQAIDFAELHNLEFGPNPEDPSDLGRKILVLDGRRPLPHRRLQHQYSQKMVERKRSSRPLPEVIHRTVFENPKAGQLANELKSESSLFVQDISDNSQLKIPFGRLNTAKISPLASSSSPSASFGSSSLSATNMSNIQQASTWSPTNSLQPSSTTNNPFAPSSTSTGNFPDHSSTPVSSSHSLFATKVDNERIRAASLFKTGPKTSTNPFSSASEPTAETSLFGGQKPASSNMISVSTMDSMAESHPLSNPFAGNNLEIGNDTTNRSISLAPPPVPQAERLPEFKSAALANIAGCASGSDSSVQNQSAAVLGQKPLPSVSLGLTPFGGSNLAKPTVTTMDATSTYPKEPVFQGNFRGSIPDTKVTPSPAISPPTTARLTFPSVQLSTNPSASGTSMMAPANTTPTSFPETSIRSPPAQENGGSSTEDVVAQTKPPMPPRDLMGDFTKWFVKGDNGILEQFQIFIIDELVRKTFDAFEKETAEKRRKAEDDRVNEQVEKFRTYNLSLKYFYKWKHNAREKRLSTLRRSGRDQLRTFYISRYTAERKAQQEVAAKATRQRTEAAKVNRSEEFRDMLKRKKVTRGEAPKALLSSGVLSEVANERDVIESNAQRKFRSRSNSTSSNYQSKNLSPSSSQNMGSKTRALRELYLGKRSRFRRSLPSTSSRECEPSIATRPASNASSRWRVKAMGIEELSDGTAVPEFMAYDMRSRPTYYSNLAFDSSLGNSTVRQASARGRSQTNGSPIKMMGISTMDDGFGNNKRKRSSEGDVEERTATKATADRSKHKRIMSEAEKLTCELKALRQELEEGRDWFRCQNERLRSESRGAETLWLDDSI